MKRADKLKAGLRRRKPIQARFSAPTLLCRGETLDPFGFYWTLWAIMGESRSSVERCADEMMLACKCRQQRGVTKG